MVGAEIRLSGVDIDDEGSVLDLSLPVRLPGILVDEFSVAEFYWEGVNVFFLLGNRIIAPDDVQFDITRGAEATRSNPRRYKIICE